MGEINLLRAGYPLLKNRSRISIFAAREASHVVITKRCCTQLSFICCVCLYIGTGNLKLPVLLVEQLNWLATVKYVTEVAVIRTKLHKNKLSCGTGTENTGDM
jgi:hypothetical protein